jgi:dipeptidyl-peptidase-4
MSKLTIAILLCASVAGASEPSDPFLRDLALTQRFELGNPTRMQPTPDGKAIFFLRAEPRSPVNSLYRFDVATGETKKLLAPEDVLRGAEEKLSAAERQQRERTRQSGRGFVHFELSRDGKIILAALSGRLFTVRVADNDVSELKIVAQPVLNPALSPDGTQIAFVHERDLYVYDLHAHKERRLTRATDPAISNGMAEFVAEEELDRVQGFWWSPDSRALAFEEADARGVEKLSLPDLAHPERATEPALYPRAGKPNVKVRVGIVATAGGAPRWLAWDTQKLPYLAKTVWSDKAPLTLVLLSRDQKTTAVVAFEPRGGAGKTLVTEEDPQFLELDSTVPRWLPDGSGFLWSSVATGAPRLELRAADGKLVRPLSTAAEYYTGLGAVDGARRLAWFTGAPTAIESRVYRVSLDGGPASAISHAPAPAVSRAGFGAHSAGLWVESYRAGDGVPHHSVHVDDDKGDRVVGELPSVAVAPPFALKQQLVRIGEQQLWAAIVRPRNFDATKKYPVIVDVYAGPHVTVVRASPSPLRQWIADHGVIVVAIDGRGTPLRGNAFARYIAGDFSRTLDDQVAGLQALGAQFKELDLSRVGIIGWSFGGYESALAVLLRPDVFHVAVAGAPVVDWHDYDTAYTERYLGLPADNAKGYDASSLITYAARLARPLLVVHGTDDDNVYFLHSLKLMDALFRAGRPAQLLPLPGFTHRVADPVVTEQLNRRTLRFLLDVLQAPQAPAKLPPPVATAASAAH